jgi:poly(3-hydroxybutyrate) depolymerase
VQRHLAAIVVGCACATLCAAPLASSRAEAKVEKLTFASGGINRTYYLYIPEKAAEGKAAPLLLLLHGSGRDGRTLVDPWQRLAREEGIVLVAPDASDRSGWRIPEDGPQFLHDLIELVRLSHDVVDDRRMYIFGHSAGAIHGLGLGLMESEYFAAVAAHAGVVGRTMAPLLTQAPRKIPMAIWVGTDDALFPLKAVRDSRDAVNAHGFNLKLTEIARHTHNYYGAAARINPQVWDFLKEHRLSGEPRYQPYRLIAK